MFLHSLPIFPTHYLLSYGISYHALIQGIKISRVPIIKKKKRKIVPEEELIVVVHSPSCVLFFVTPWTAVYQTSLSLTISQSFPKFISNELVIPSNHLVLCCPLLLLPSTFPSIRIFPSESAVHIQWDIFSISPSKEYSGLISFNIDWFDLLTFHGTLRSLLQHHGLKASVLRTSAFFIVQLSHLYICTRKTVALTIQIFVGKVDVFVV